MSEEEGTWMTIEEIKEAGSTLAYSSIYNRIKYSGKFESRKVGGRLEVFITSENMSRLKIKNVLDFTERQPLERNASEVLVHTASGDYTISAKQEYGLKHFSDVMRGVLPKSANSKAIEELFDTTARREGQSKRIRGSRLIGLVLTSRDAEFLNDDLFTYLSGEAGINIDKVCQELQTAAEGCIKRLSPNLPYIPRTDIPKVVKAIRREVYGVDDWPQEVDLEKGKRVQEPPTRQEIAEEVTAKPEPANRFFIEVPGILGGTRIYFEIGDKQLRVKEVRNKPGGIEVIVDSEEPVNGSKGFEIPSGKEIILTAPKLSKLTKLHISTIRARLDRYKEQLRVTRGNTLGRPYEAIITSKNYHLVGLTEEKAMQLFQSEETPEPPPTVQKPPQAAIPSRKGAVQEQTAIIDISGKSHEFTLSRIYEPEEIREILKQVHAGIFTDVTVTNVLSALKAESGLEGKKFVEYIGQVNGIMNLNSTGTQLKLEQMGTSVEDLKTDMSLSRYLRTASGLREPYIVRADLSEIQTAVSERGSSQHFATDSEKERRAALTEWEKTLEERNILPRGPSLTKLIEAGVLSTESASSINDTYSRFVREMDGFAYFSLNELRKSIPGEPEWREFFDDYMPRLIKAGVVKNIAQSCGGSTGSHLYVVKRGVFQKDMLSILTKVHSKS